MDNLTHSLIGAAVAEAAHLSFPGRSGAKQGPRESARRNTFYLASILGNNFPDFDFLYAGITPGKLGYLLHHRGHTHTLLGIVPQWFIILFLLRTLLSAKTRLLLGKRDKVLASLVAFSGLLLHLLADSWNSYGIHPFFPFNLRWYYGDSIFIIEPILWTILGSFLWLQTRNRLSHATLELILLALPLVLFLGGALAWRSLALLVFLAAGLGFFLPRFEERKRSLLTLALVGVFVLGMFAQSGVLRHRIQTEWQARFPRTTLHDVVLTPFPAQPFCWSFITVETDSDSPTYLARGGVLSALPGWVSAGNCVPPRWLRAAANLPLNEKKTENPGIALISFHEMPLKELRAGAQSNCFANAWLRFGRVPFLKNGAILDLRFTLGDRENFSQIRLNDLSCPRFVPPWEYPRQDLLLSSEATVQSP